jgi:hypothetical protein
VDDVSLTIVVVYVFTTMIMYKIVNDVGPLV